MNSTCKNSDISMRVCVARDPMPSSGVTSTGWRKESQRGPGMCSSRVALYLSQAEGSEGYFSALIVCARQARLLGLRVVTIVAEDETVPDKRSRGLGGARLGRLVDRMGDGQFDAIVAHTCHGMIVIGGPVSPVHGGFGYRTDDAVNNA